MRRRRMGPEYQRPRTLPPNCCGAASIRQGSVMIQIQNIIKTYGKKDNLFTALDDVSFEVPDNSTVSIIGKSGSQVYLDAHYEWPR